MAPTPPFKPSIPASKLSHPQQFPQLGAPLVDPLTGMITTSWYHLLLNLWNRTGQEPGGLVQITGQIIAYAVDVIQNGPPLGWLVCDGSAVDRKIYATLFSLIGNQYGNGNGSTTFNVPNLAGGIILGATLPQYPLAQTNSAGISGAGITYVALNYLIKT